MITSQPVKGIYLEREVLRYSDKVFVFILPVLAFIFASIIYYIHSCKSLISCRKKSKIYHIGQD
jgi:hypothetical protein